ncbi:MAG: DUF192 domain-containing protein [Pseudomonadota bacterium]
MTVQLFVGKKLIAGNLRVADNFGLRLRGLMFRKCIELDEGLIIPKCNWVHTMFMNFPIDILYLNSSYTIVDAVDNVKPWSMCYPRFKAKHTVELAPGTIANKSLRLGEVIRCIA